MNNNLNEDSLSPVFETIVSPGGSFRIILVGDLHLSNASPVSRKDKYSDTMIDKLNQVADLYEKVDADIVLFTGDIWNTSQQPDVIKIRVMGAFNRFRGNAYCVVGNHDIIYARIDSVHKLPLGVLLASGVLKRLGSIEIFSKEGESLVLIQGMDYIEKNPTLPEPLSEKSLMKLLLIHNYIYCRSESYGAPDALKSEGFPVSPWDGLFIGHDHSFLDKQVGNKIAINPGALSRGTISLENRTREVGVFVVDVELSLPLKLDYIFVPLKYKSAEEVYSELSVSRREVTKKMDAFVTSLAQQSFREGSELADIVAKLCTGNKRMLKYINKHLFDHGIVSGV